MVMYGYCTRYPELQRLVDFTFRGSNATGLNIFIDATDILYKISQYIKKTDEYIGNCNVLVSGLINIAAHYRSFFASRYQCHTKIWIVYSKENVIGKKYHGQFDYRIKSSSLEKTLYEQAIYMAADICKLIPDVDVQVTIADFLTKSLGILKYEKATNPSIFITKDEFNYQVCMYDKMYVLRPKKKISGEDISALIHTNAVDYFIADISKSQIKSISGISNTLIHPIMALSRVPSRNLRSVYRIQQTVSTILDAINRQVISQSYPWDINKFFESLALDKKRRESINILIERFKACDVVNTQLLAYECTAEYLTYNGIVNVYDPNGAKAINEEYFKECPLNLEAF